MPLTIVLADDVPRVAGVYDALREAILDGRLRAGDRMPATRAFAETLGVSRGTVTTVYDRLVAEGYLMARQGSGTFVAEAGASVPKATQSGRGSKALRTGRPDLSAPPVWASAATVATATHNFALGVPDGRLFPLPVWRRLVSAQLRSHRMGQAGRVYSGVAGDALETEIARHIGLARGVLADPGQVTVTSGAQQAIDVLSRVLLSPGDQVAVEDPGYGSAARIFASHRARLRPVPVDAEGIVVDRLPRGVRLVYVTPSHQFPLGVAMTLARRTALLEWADRHDAVIIEDDYDSEFRYSARPLEPLYRLDRTERVIYVGSFSKTLLPELRLGYAIAPVRLAPAVRAAKELTDWSSDPTTRGALAAFLAEGHLSAHVRRATKVYRERHDALLAGLDGLDGLRDWLEVIPSAVGLHVSTHLRDRSVDDQALSRAALTSGVHLEPLSFRSRASSPRPGLVFGFGAIEASRIGPGLDQLASVLRGRLEP